MSGRTAACTDEIPAWRLGFRVQALRPLLSLALLLLFSSAFARADSISVPEARGPVRDLQRSLADFHFHLERRAAGELDLRVLASYFWHMAQEAQALSSASETGMDKHELLSMLSHLQGWFQYTEQKVRRSVLESELFDRWNEAHRIFVQIASLILFRLDPSLEISSSPRQRLAPSQLDALRSTVRFENVVARELAEGKVVDPHLDEPQGAARDGYWKDRKRMSGTPSKWPKRPQPIPGSFHSKP